MFVLVINNELVVCVGTKFDCEREKAQLDDDINAQILPAWFNPYTKEIEW